MNWIRYRFHSSSVEDYRPVIHDTNYPWWCSGEAGDGSFVILVAYLPEGEDLKKYWPEATDIDAEPEDTIEFTSRFPKPHWYTGDQ